MSDSVLIIGGGIAGVQAALDLAEAGARVLCCRFAQQFRNPIYNGLQLTCFIRPARQSRCLRRTKY